MKYNPVEENTNSNAESRSGLLTRETRGAPDHQAPLSELITAYDGLPDFSAHEDGYARFNGQAALIEEDSAVLLVEHHGWSWKQKLPSVILEKQGEGTLEFSGGIACLDGKYYMPADIHAHFKGYDCVEDFLLQEGYRTNESDAVGLDVLLERCRLTTETEIPPSRTLLRLGDVNAATNANLVDVVAQSKAGKTALLSGAVAAALSGENHLGWEAENRTGAIIYIDTDQSLADCRRSVIDTAMRRCGLTTMPDNLLVYNVKRERTEDAWRLVQHSMKQAKEDFGAVFMVVIDGVADLIKSVNDEEESTRLVADLLKLATEYDTSIITVLHANPGARSNPSDISKGRGHLGSQLERKCETLVALRKSDENQVTRITAPVTRGKPLIGQDTLFMGWDEATGMFQLIEPEVSLSDDAAHRELKQFHRAWGKSIGAQWTKTELIKRLQDESVMDDLQVSESTARRLFRSWCLSDTMVLRPGTTEHDWICPAGDKYFKLQKDEAEAFKLIEELKGSTNE